MSLRIKINLVVLVCCALSFLFIYMSNKQILNHQNQIEIENKAHLIMKVSDSIESNGEQDSFFADDLLSQSNQYSYDLVFKEAINSNYQANIWQLEVIDELTTTKSNEFKGVKSDENGEFYILAHRIVNSDNIVIGARIIRIYKQAYSEKLASQMQQLAVMLVAILVLLLLIINLLIHLLVLKPIKNIASQANQISRGQTTISELSIEGKDEISELSQSFNRIIRSLKAAMKLIS